MPSRTIRFLFGPFALAFFGLLFALWNVLGDTSALCVTEGCSLFQNFTIAGYSLWWLGVIGFAVLLIPALFGFAKLGEVLAGLGLTADIVLLAIMLITAPCFNCLIIGLMLAITYVAFRHAATDKRIKRSFPILIGIWTVFFVVNAGGILRESTTPWAIRAPAIEQGGIQNAPVHIYFSPSCSACRELVNGIASQERQTGQQAPAVWYPVAEDDKDIFIIISMYQKVQEGKDLDVAMAEARDEFAAKDVTFADRITLLSPRSLLAQLRLWQNMAHVLSSGSNRLPFVEYRGIPSGLLDSGQSSSQASGQMSGQPSGQAPAYAPSGPTSTSSPSGLGGPISGPVSTPATPSAGAPLPFLGVDAVCGDPQIPCDE